MKRAALLVALLTVAVSGCSSPSSTGASSQPAGTALASASQDPPAAGASSSPSSTTSAITPTPATNAAESVGQELGAKIAFYAIAKAAGIDESAKIDALASGICSRIESGKPATVGPWMADTFQLEGDVAAKVALAAIEFACPQ